MTCHFSVDCWAHVIGAINSHLKATGKYQILPNIIQTSQTKPYFIKLSKAFHRQAKKCVQLERLRPKGKIIKTLINI